MKEEGVDEKREEHLSDGLKEKDEATVFVRPIPDVVESKEDLRIALSEFGEVAFVHINPGRKYAFVHFADVDSAVKAKEVGHANWVGEDLEIKAVEAPKANASAPENMENKSNAQVRAPLSSSLTKSIAEYLEAEGGEKNSSVIGAKFGVRQKQLELSGFILTPVAAPVRGSDRSSEYVVTAPPELLEPLGNKDGRAKMGGVREEHLSDGLKDKDEATVFVRPIPDVVESKEDLRIALSEFGEVVFVHIESRRKYAFVHFADVDSAVAAKEIGIVNWAGEDLEIKAIEQKSIPEHTESKPIGPGGDSHCDARQQGKKRGGRGGRRNTGGKENSENDEGSVQPPSKLRRIAQGTQRSQWGALPRSLAIGRTPPPPPPVRYQPQAPPRSRFRGPATTSLVSRPPPRPTVAPHLRR